MKVTPLYKLNRIHHGLSHAYRCVFVQLCLAMATACWIGHATLAQAAQSETMFGAEAFPDGQPIGGGPGYSAGPSKENASHRVDSLKSLQEALAAARAGEVVWIESGSTIDFTGVRLKIPENVTLAGDRGQGDSAGPLLYARHTGSEYFVQMQTGSRLTGVRVQGSNPLLKDIDTEANDPSGYAVDCCNAEVDNCEISQFQRGGVAMFRDCSRSLIHHNFIHDIGAYPILLGNGTGDGHVIEGNRIEWAWHAVASNGSRGSGCLVRNNEFRRVERPAKFDPAGNDSPNWCLDIHSNEGGPTKPDRPKTRQLIVERNTFLADASIKIGDGSELLKKMGLYPKHDIYVGAGKEMATKVEIRGNLFLMHEKSCGLHPFKPYGQAIRLVGLRGHPKLPDDPGSASGTWQVVVEDNKFSGAR